IRQFGNSAIRQFGNSAIRQFGNSAIRQFGNSLNRSLTLAVALSAALTVSVRAQFDPTVSQGDTPYDNLTYWVGGTINNLFFGNTNLVTVSVPDAVFDIGATVIATGAVNAKQFNVGDHITGDGIAENTVITAINNAGQITLSKATVGAATTPLTVTVRADLNRTARNQSGVPVTYTEGSNIFTTTANAYHYFSVTQTHDGNNLDGAKVITSIIDEHTFVDSATATAAGTQNWNIFVNGNVNWGWWTISTNNNPRTITDDYFVLKSGDFANVRIGTTPNWLFAPASGTFTFILDAGWAGDSLQFELGQSNNTYLNNRFDFQNNAAVFNITPANVPLIDNGALGLDMTRVHVTATNLSSLTKDGVGTLLLDSNLVVNGTIQHKINVNNGGAVNINNGQIVVNSANLVLDAPRLSGAKEYNLNNYGAVLQLIAGTGSGNLIEPDAAINLRSGIFNAYGTTVSANQQVGTVTLKAGRSIIGTAGANQNFTLTMEKLLREGDTTVNFLFGNIATPVIISDAANAAALEQQLVGGILPWASGQTSSAPNGYSAGSAWNNGYFGGGSFITVSGGTIRMLADIEYYDTNSLAISAAPTTANVRLRVDSSVDTNGTLTVSTTINALRVTGWNNQMRFQNNATLTLTSGALLFSSEGGNGLGNPNIAGNASGALDTGARPLIIQGGANSTAINIPYVNSIEDNTQAGLIVAMKASSNIELNPVGTGVMNNYGGYTLVQSGSLIARKTGALNMNAALLLDKPGTLTIGSIYNNIGALIAVTELRGDGKVDFAAGTDASPNQLNINANPRTGDDVNNTIAVGAGGVIAPGGVATPGGVGTLTLGANVNAVNFLADSVFAVDIAGNGLSDTLAFTNNAATLNFNAGATIALNFLNDYSPAEGDSWLFATGYNALGSVFDQDNITVTGLAADTYEWALDHGAL
ncbi:MAG: hypothetical protein LBK60_10145, partial [Verrucomicrobiales bacterium]|nr:hypothetical protein [Verrucomicrobiales bacterium]